MPTKRPLSLLTILIVLAVSTLPAQQSVEYSMEAEQVFSKAIELFNKGEFSEAAAKFDLIIKQLPVNQRTTASYLMRAKALLRVNEPLEAARTLRNFSSLFPKSSYQGDADYTMGLVFLRIQRYDDAVQSFLSAWKEGGTPAHSAINALDRTLDAHFSATDILRFLDRSQVKDERAFFWLKIGEKYASTGKSGSVGEVLDTLYRRYEPTEFDARVAALRSRIERGSSVKLGVLLPLMSKSEPSAIQELGNDINDGIQLAVEEFAGGPSGNVKVTLETRDTEREVAVASKAIQELTNDNDVIGVIGPVFSNIASAVAPLANKKGCPLVSPTANANGIAAVGPYVFQANPDYDTRGRAMARFAVEKRGLKVLAVLAPVNSFGKFMAESFAAEVLHLGGKVIAMEWYERGAADLKSQMANIRKAGLKAGAEPMLAFGKKMSREDIVRLVDLGVSMSVIDSLMNVGSVVSASSLFGPRARIVVDSAGIAASYEDPKVDSLEYPVTAIDGIYLPVSSADEIGIVSSQLVYYNIKCQLLGSGEWNNLSGLIENKRYCNDVIFESDSYVDPSDSSYISFQNKVLDRFKKKPGKNMLYGYDTAMLMLNAIAAGANSRELLMKAMSEARQYRGLHAMINFSPKRVNTWLWIVQFSGERIRLVDGFNVE